MRSSATSSPSDDVPTRPPPGSAVGTAALAGFVVGAWTAEPLTSSGAAATALVTGAAVVVALALALAVAPAVPKSGGARHGGGARGGVVLVTAAAWTAVGFGLSGATYAAYASSIVTREGPVRVVGTLGDDGRGAGHGSRRVLRVPGGRVILVTRATPVRAPAGARVAVVGTLRPLRADRSVRDRMRRSRVGGELVVDSATVTAPPPWPAAAAAVVRRHLRDAASVLDGGDRSALLLGLLTGDDSDMSASTRATFRRAGLSHLLAVSGANLAVVAAAVGALVAVIPVDRRLRLVCVAIGVASYVLVTQAEPSVLRAAVTAGVALVAAWRGVLRDAARGFAPTVLAMAVCDPWLVDDIGFQLSVAATAGILHLAAPLARRMPSTLPTALRVATAVTVAAQIAVLPLVGWHFGTLPLVGFVANLPAVPIAEAVTVGGAVLAPVTFVVPDAFVLLTPLLDALRRCAEFFGAVPWAGVAVGRPYVVVGVAVVAVVAPAVVALRKVSGPTSRRREPGGRSG